jgi:hypothetical protein
MVIMKTNQHQCSQYNPAASSERSQFSAVLVNMCQRTRPPALFSSPGPPPHGPLGSKAAIIVVKIHYPLLSLQAMVLTSRPPRSQACGAPGAATPQHHEISISLLRMRAGIKPELCHIVGQLAQVCLLKVIMGELERERARRRARFGL